MARLRNLFEPPQTNIARAFFYLMMLAGAVWGIVSFNARAYGPEHYETPASVYSTLPAYTTAIMISMLSRIFFFVGRFGAELMASLDRAALLISLVIGALYGALLAKALVWLINIPKPKVPRPKEPMPPSRLRELLTPPDSDGKRKFFYIILVAGCNWGLTSGVLYQYYWLTRFADTLVGHVVFFPVVIARVITSLPDLIAIDLFFTLAPLTSLVAIPVGGILGAIVAKSIFWLIRKFEQGENKTSAKT